MIPPQSESERLAALEQAVARLTDELAGLRADVARQPSAGVAHVGTPPLGQRVDPPAAAVPAPRPTLPPGEAAGRIEAFNAAVSGSAAPKPAQHWEGVFASLGIQPPPATGARATKTRPKHEGLETLIGKYGTLALAALTILLGVGAFLGWAIRNGLIGPELRVALGALGAVVLAIVGWRMRHGENRRFGDVLLALALAVVHVVAWSAGPRLHVVSSTAALTVAALASAALGWLAWKEEQQALFNVGFGGALLAPFVTSTGDGDAMVMLGFGIIVIGGGLAALSNRTWAKTPWVVASGVVLYTAVAVDRLSADIAWHLADAPALFGLFVAALVLMLARPPARSRLMYVALTAALVALVAASNGPSLEWPTFALALLTTLGALIAATQTERGPLSHVVGAFILPVGALGVAVAALHDATSVAGLGTALLWAALSAGACVANRDGDRAAHAFTATFAVGIGAALATESRPVVFCILIGAMGIAGVTGWCRYALPSVGYASLLWLAGATARAFVLLSERAAYQYTPMLTSASAAAAVVTAAWVFASWHISRSLAPEGVAAKDVPRAIIRLLGAAVAFLWIHEELARAVSTDVSVFLLVAYYATTGVLTIYAGRVRALPILRHIGLALAVFAALKTIAESSSLAIGWRVGAYLLAGVFLLGVAYWYRSQGTAPDHPLEAAQGAERVEMGSRPR